MCSGLWLERDYGRPASELFHDPDFVRGYVVRLARGIKAAIMLLNPARIVIGGGIGKAGDRLFAPLREELGRQIPAWSRARVDVQPAALLDDSVLYGALVLAETSWPGESRLTLHPQLGGETAHNRQRRRAEAGKEEGRGFPEPEPDPRPPGS